MGKHIKKHIKPVRLDGLPADMRHELKEARRKRGWSQAELGRRASLPQMHISGIERVQFFRIKIHRGPAPLSRRPDPRRGIVPPHRVFGLSFDGRG